MTGSAGIAGSGAGGGAAAGFCKRWMADFATSAAERIGFRAAGAPSLGARRDLRETRARFGAFRFSAGAFGAALLTLGAFAAGALSALFPVRAGFGALRLGTRVNAMVRAAANFFRAC